MNTHSMNLRSILDANKLTGPNFIDWLRNLRIVLRSEKVNYVLDGPVPPQPAEDASDEELDAYNKHLEDNEMATCVMLASISP